jgi:hypothetical protein
MTAGILTALTACLVLGQAANDPSFSNQRNHQIPVNIEASRRAEIRELLLFASTDQGKSWQQIGAILPDKPGFNFFATKDADYWMRVALVTTAGKQEPDERALMKGPPDLRMIIDTIKPIVQSIRSQRDGDDLFVTWDIQEEHLDYGPGMMKLEYQAKDMPAGWTPVTCVPGLKGQARFRVNTKHALVIRLTVRDKAGNESFGLTEVAGTIAAAGFTANAASDPVKQDVTMTLPREIGLPQKPMDEIKPPPFTFQPIEGPPKGLDKVIPPPQEIQKPVVGNPDKVIPPPAQEVKTEKAIADTRTPPVIAPKLDPSKIAAPNGIRPAKHDQPGPVAVTTPPRRPLPALQYINTTQVMLEYELKRVGPSGVGGIELWLTKDDGESWEQVADDEDVSSGAQQTRQKRAFEFRDRNDLPFRDGIYGLTIVIKNRAGLGKKPRAGDAPEVRIEIDSKAPDGQLLPLSRDPQNPDHVLLRWSAEDKNLGSNPIALEYAEKLDGPWLPIQTDLENTGRYSWKVAPTTPVQVYLRLRVRDKAGNEGLAVTAQPQFVDLVEPEGGLIGVQPGGKRP